MSSAQFATFADVQNAMTFAGPGGSAQISLDGGSTNKLTLLGVTQPSQLHSANFVLA